jgi:hypothetical protein
VDTGKSCLPIRGTGTEEQIEAAERLRLLLQVFGDIDPERALTEVSFSERKSECASPGLLFQTLQKAFEAEVSSRTKALKSGLSASEILRATQMVNKLFDFLSFIVCHHILAATLTPVLGEACR